jgi:hypothetical protein
MSPEELFKQASVPIPCKVSQTNDSLALIVAKDPRFVSLENGSSYVFATDSAMYVSTMGNIRQLIFVNFGKPGIGYCGAMNGAVSLIVVDVPVSPDGNPQVSGSQFHLAPGAPV